MYDTKCKGVNIEPLTKCKGVNMSHTWRIQNAIDMIFDYRASNKVTVISLVEDDWFLLDEVDFFPTKKPNSLGSGNELSPCNIITTHAIFGRSL